MKAGKYTIKELFVNRTIEQVVIPEIQRDYVWQPLQVKKLMDSIKDDYNTFLNFRIPVEIKETDEVASELFEQFYKRLKCASNIGFVYAYTDGEYPGKYFLIDGQQRLTTVYLILMVLAESDPTFTEAFKKLYYSENIPYLSYRVRENAYSFFTKAMKYYLRGGDDITNQSWYHTAYASDKTIASIISNVTFIRAYIRDNDLIKSEFTDYIQHYVEFWYFDTNMSEQGEELYIYMNARGENMHSSENLKADLLAKIPESSISLALKNDWGRKWEEWQDFFWRIRGKKENADDVFDEFIYCTAGLENSLKGLGIVKKVNKKKESEPILHDDLLFCFDINGLDTIENYYNAMIYLCDRGNKENFIKQYDVEVSWVNDMVGEIKKLLNSSRTNWFAEDGDKNRGVEHNRMVFLWSLLFYTASYSGGNKLDDVFRAARIFYCRYKNYDRSIKSIHENCTQLLVSGVFYAGATDEERIKYPWLLNRHLDRDFRVKEALIWHLEDHPINLNGRDVGLINSSHLIDYERGDYDAVELEKICEEFYKLFPVKDGEVVWDNWHKLISTLLFYGSFWLQKITNDYTNLDFDDDRRIVRDIDSPGRAFKSFFTDLLDSDLETLYNEIVLPVDRNEDSENRLEQLRWYAGQLRGNMWKEGYFIAIGQHKHRRIDKYFNKTYRLVNTRGNFNGGNPEVLSRLIKKEMA